VLKAQPVVIESSAPDGTLEVFMEKSFVWICTLCQCEVQKENSKTQAVPQLDGRVACPDCFAPVHLLTLSSVVKWDENITTVPQEKKLKSCSSSGTIIPLHLTKLGSKTCR
jgi:hypothetical protein